MSLTDPLPALPSYDHHTVFHSEVTLARLALEVLPAYIAGARWFGGKARAPQRFHIRDVVPISTAPDAARLLLVEVEYPAGSPDTYLLPLQIATGLAAAPLPPTAIVARFTDGAVLFDALHDEAFRTALFNLMAGSHSVASPHGQLVGVPGAALSHYVTAPPSWVHAVEQSNSSVIYDDRIFLKLYRRLEEGVNPDAEILRFLGERSFPHVPPFGGAVEYRASTGGTRILALGLGMVPNNGDAWAFTLHHLGEFFTRLSAGQTAEAAAYKTQYLERATQLGRRTGELHLALATASQNPDFHPEPLTHDDFAKLSATIRSSAEEIHQLVSQRLDALDPTTRAQAERLLTHADALRARADALATFSTSAAKTRTHGDYHLGQVLHGPGGFIIIDFEGEPLRPLAERRRKMSPFRDVAGMLRSFHYAAHAALEPLDATQRTALTADAERWHQKAAAAFLDAWISSTLGAAFRDRDPLAERELLNAFLLEKALYEVRYEVNNRPTWLGIPLRGVLSLLDAV